MIDLHCHLPFNVSDGPREIGQSIEIMKTAAAAGTTYINAVSHMAGTREDRDRAVEKLRPHAAQLGITLHSGCEYDFLHFRSNMKTDTGICFIGPGSRYVLIDLRSAVVPFGAPEQIRELLEDDIKVIIVHPEMLFGWYQAPAMQAMIDAGAVFQINASSLAGICGYEPKKTALKCIEAGMVHLIASDAHRTEGNRRWAMDEAYKLLRKRYGEKICKVLFETNPQLLLENRPPIAIGKQSPRSIFARLFS